ncbi:MAG: hypothetical protein WC621_02300 [Patescibacteria group bacterium]
MKLGEFPAQDIRDMYTRVGNQAEVILSPEAESLADFHAFLEKNFKPGEVESLEVFQEEMSRNKNPDSKTRFICTLLKDPLDNKFVSGAYGSVQDGILAIRFTLTEAKLYLGYPVSKQEKKPGFKGFRGYRGTGLSQRVDELLLGVAREQQELMHPGKKLEVLVGEAVDQSEAYWNGFEIEPGNGMRRLYKPGNGEQVYYRLPPLEWNADGTPFDNRVVKENLQIAVAGSPKQISVEKLAQVLKSWWDSWYIRRRERFQDDKAWEKHKNTVRMILEDEIIKPIKNYEVLDLLSRDEREKNN